MYCTNIYYFVLGYRMINSIKLNNFLLHHWYHCVVLGVLLWVIIFSSVTLTTKPRLWADEAKSIELSYNFLNFGVLDIQTAPGEFSGISHLLQSTGYPITITLALFFKVFGYSFVGARVFMLIWMLAMLLFLFCFFKKVYGHEEALLALILIASFAPFFDNGRTVVGEIPGFLFLLLGLEAWLARNKYLWVGVWWGFAIVTKPSVYIAVIPTIILILILKSGGIKKLFFVAAGMMPAAVFWMVLIFRSSIISSRWRDVGLFFQNPFGTSSISANIINSFYNALFSTTLIYFATLFFIILFARKYVNNDMHKKLLLFTIIFTFFSFIYYLRSPGWLRYIIAAELLILMSVPSAVLLLSNKLFLRSTFGRLFIALLFLIQILRLFTGAHIYSSDSAIRVGEYINKTFSGKSVGVLNDLTVGIFLDPAYKYQLVEMTGIPVMGTNPLLHNPALDVLVFADNEKFVQLERSILKTNYHFHNRVAEYNIYIR